MKPATMATTKAARQRRGDQLRAQRRAAEPGRLPAPPTTAPPWAAKPVQADSAIVAATTSGTPGKRGHRRQSPTSTAVAADAERPPRRAGRRARQRTQ